MKNSKEEVQPENTQNSCSARSFIERLSQKWESLSPEKRVYFTQLGLMAAAQAVDILTTSAVFQTFPRAMELNPVADFFLDKGGMVTLGLVKMGATAGVITAFELFRNKALDGGTSQLNNNSLRFWNCLLTAASVNNVAQLFMK